MLKKFFLKHDKIIHRLLEILPGAFSWSAILLLLIGGFIIPTFVAYIVILFYVFWFYKSVNIALFSVITYFRIKASQMIDWVGEAKGFPDWQKVHHVVVIVTYKEPLHILERTLDSLANQDLPLRQLSVVMATEKRDTDAPTKMKNLQKNTVKSSVISLLLSTSLPARKRPARPPTKTTPPGSLKKNL